MLEWRQKAEGRRQKGEGRRLLTGVYAGRNWSMLKKLAERFRALNPTTRQAPPARAAILDHYVREAPPRSTRSTSSRGNGGRACPESGRVSRPVSCRSSRIRGFIGPSKHLNGLCISLVARRPGA